MTDPRQAYQVRRYHTWNVIHDQSVGEHSIQVWRILRAIWPDAPAHVQEHCLTHDIGELVTGDLPYPVKKVNPGLGDHLAALERIAHAEMTDAWKLPSRKVLSAFEHSVFKIAEYLEMWEYGLDEVLLGNHNALLIVSRMSDAFRELLNSNLLQDTQQSAATINYITKRKAQFNSVKGS